MKWKYCNYCPLDGTCENQDRGHECEMPVKKLLEENTQLHKFLEEFNALDVAKENQHLRELLKECKEHLCHHCCQITVGKLEKKIHEVLK